MLNRGDAQSRNTDTIMHQYHFMTPAGQTMDIKIKEVPREVIQSKHVKKVNRGTFLDDLELDKVVLPNLQKVEKAMF